MKRNVVFGVLLALIGMVSIIAANPGNSVGENADYPYIVAVNSQSTSMFESVPGTVVVFNPRTNSVFGNLMFQTMAGSNLATYENITLPVGNSVWTVPLRKMGNIRVAIKIYSYPAYDSDGKAVTGTSIGMPKKMIEERIDIVNQYEAPRWHGGNYLRRADGTTMW